MTLLNAAGGSRVPDFEPFEFMDVSIATMTESDFDLLVAPIGANPPFGENPRFAAPAVDLYRQLRDMRGEARQDERRQEAADDSLGGLTLSSAWSEVRRLSIRILGEYAKDIEVLVWLTEAETRLSGHAGLAQSLRVIRELVEQHGPELHPRPEDPGDDPFMALAGLNGIGREGTLIQPLRLVPLVPGSEWGQNSLWATSDVDGSVKVESAMAAVGPSAMGQVFADVQAARTELDALDALLSDKLGGNAPPFAQLRSVLDDTERTIRRMSELTESPIADAPPEAQTPGAPAPTPAASQQITTREEAFAQLLRISAYFRQAEPHSPIGFALETLVRRGRMDFMTLLRELVPDASAREIFMTNAGIRKPETDEATE